MSTEKIHRWWFLVLLVGLITTPFVYYVPARIPFEVPKVWVVLGWIEACLLMTVGLFQDRLKLSIRLMSLFWSVFGVMVIASLFGQDMLHSLFGNYYRMDGLLTYFHLWLLATMIAWYATPQVWRIILIALAVTSLVLSSMAILFYLGNFSLLGLGLWNGAVGLMFGNPNFLAGYLVVTYPTVLYLGHLFQAKTTNSLWQLFVYIPLVAVVFTASRAALLVLGFFWVLVWLESMSKKSSHFMGIVFIGALVSCALVWFKNDTGNPSLVFAPESRERIIRKMLDGFQTHPFLGYGWAHASKAFEIGVWPYVVRFDVHVDKAHSTLLEYLVTTGILGFMLYVTFLIFLMRTLHQDSLRSNQKVFWWMMLLFVVYAQTNVLSISTEVLFSVLVGRALQEH